MNDLPINYERNQTTKTHSGERKNRINAYHCTQCGGDTITFDLCPGVTPFIINCPKCGDLALSKCYEVDQSLIPSHEFFKPNSPPRNKADREHWKNGGLTLRKIGQLSNVIKNLKVIENRKKRRKPMGFKKPKKNGNDGIG